MKNKRLLFAVFIGLALCLYVLGCGNVSGGGGGGGGGSSGQTWAYWGNNSTNCIYYSSVSSANISGTIELGCYSPYYMTKSTDEAKLYVSTASHEVLVIDTSSNTITQLITLDAPTASKAMRVSADGNYLYMGVNDNNNIYKVYLNEGTYESVSEGGIIKAIALKPDGSEIYYCNGQYISFNNTTYTLPQVHEIDLGTSRTCNDMTVKNGKVYAPIYNSTTGECIIVDTTNDAWSIITSEGNSLFGAVGIPGTDEVYVSSSLNPGFIYIINTLVPTFEGASITEATFRYPDYMAVTDDGRYVGVMDIAGHLKIGWVNISIRSIEAYSNIPTASLQANNIVFIYK